uniref:Uncharacterized protein n=1 Tax=Opuntia streptacantha TaxID=393608 RepID=A0A7C9AGH3_OPUST
MTHTIVSPPGILLPTTALGVVSPAPPPLIAMLFPLISPAVASPELCPLILASSKTSKIFPLPSMDSQAHFHPPSLSYLTSDTLTSLPTSSMGHSPLLSPHLRPSNTLTFLVTQLVGLSPWLSLKCSNSGTSISDGITSPERSRRSTGGWATSKFLLCIRTSLVGGYLQRLGSLSFSRSFSLVGTLCLGPYHLNSDT